MEPPIEIKHTMAESPKTISDVTLRADNVGYSVSYTKRVKKAKNPNAQFDDSYRHEYPRESFSEEDAQKAFARFQELTGKNIKKG